MQRTLCRYFPIECMTKIEFMRLSFREFRLVRMRMERKMKRTQPSVLHRGEIELNNSMSGTLCVR